MAVHIRNLTISYRRRPAVHHLSVDFSDNTMWAICGPNGAGKSTLLKALMGLIKTDTGSIDLDGLQKRDIAYLPQQSDIDRSMPLSVYELTATGLWYETGFFGSPDDAQKERIHKALQQVQMDAYAKRNIGQLSNGQFQRVLFARMLVQKARILLLDEPFNAVDAATTHALLEILAEHRQTSTCTVIAVLHDYSQVRRYFADTLLMAREKIATGPTAGVLTETNLQHAENLMRSENADRWCTAPGDC